ncbi:MAG: hypothetical protein JOY59_04970 [Candidatus Eremiobacteraeota bacterium]|nr:hypothetical protein [Candidatus Eremiobacteraeota bacterium]
MKRYGIAFFLFAAAFLTASFLMASFAANADEHAQAAHKATSHAHKPKPAPIKIAPADEYFGRLKMSILGIGNTIKDQGLRYERSPDQVQSVLASINFAVDAIHDWQRKYPKDPWIARSLLNLERFYEKIDTDQGRAQAKATMLWLVHDYAWTPQGKQGKKELAEGTVGVAHPASAQAAPVVAPTAIDITKPDLSSSSPAPK